MFEVPLYVAGNFDFRCMRFNDDFAKAVVCDWGSTNSLFFRLIYLCSERYNKRHYKIFKREALEFNNVVCERVL